MSASNWRQRALCGAIGLGIGVAVLAAEVATAVIPVPGRTMNAIASTNRSSGRTKALQLELTMRIGDEPPIASAELISHPSGLARLEVRGYEGRIDRYLLSGDQLSGTMNGRPLFQPRPLLQPFFLLQPSTETTLRAALESFGIGTGAIGLLPCGEADCFVFGDPGLTAAYEPPVELNEKGEVPAAWSGDLNSVDLGPEDDALREAPLGAILDDPRLPRFWVDTEELQVQRIDRADGVFVLFGPTVSFERIKVPSWFEIHQPDEPFPIRFDVNRAVQVNAPPGAFDRSWLVPTELPGDPDDPA